MNQFSPKISTTRLPNGMPLVVVHSPGHATTTVLQLVATGMYYEDTHTNGISHFLEHVCFKGTRDWDSRELMRFLDGLGAETNAFTSEEFTGYYAKGARDNWKDYLMCVSQIFLHPVFPESEVIKERGVVLGEYDMYEDQPTHQAQKLLSETMFKNQPAGWQVIGTKKNISRFTASDVQDWHKTYYTPDNSLLVVVGNVDPKEVSAYARTLYSQPHHATSPAREPVVETHDGPVVAVRKAQTDQVHICVAFRGYERSHPDRHIVQVIGALLGAGMSSRLYERLREQMGAGYYVTAAHVAYTDHGYLEIRTGCESARVTEVVAAIIEECKALSQELVTQSELKKIQNYLIGHSYMGMESTDAWAEYVGVQLLLDGTALSLDDRLARLKRITDRDIERVARDVFVPERLVMVAYGDTTTSSIKSAIPKDWK
jgi:predicted Zn-dependent peptidase